MTESFALSISLLAVVISALTAWLTLFRRGTIKMTQPTVIFFGPDAPRRDEKRPPPKVYLRSLLFATSKRGRVIENMYVTLSRNETRQNFNIWVYGEKEKLVRGSGLFVGETGVAANHHFLTPAEESSFRFIAGIYRIEVFAQLVGDRSRILLFSQDLDVSKEAATALEKPDTGIYFDWGPDASRYLSHTDTYRAPPDAGEFFRGLLMETGSVQGKTDPNPMS